MKSSSSPVLLILGALTCASSIARAQDALPPEKPAPELAPLVPLSTSEKRIRAIPVRNVPAAIIAYQLDPEHNPMPPGFAPIQLGRDTFPLTPRLEEADARQFDLLTQWIQIDDATIGRELPAWSAFAAAGGSRALSAPERQTLDKLNASKQIAPLTQRVFTLDKRPAFLSYLTLRPVAERPTERLPAPSLRMVPSPNGVDPDITPQPRPDSLFADPPYIPNSAEVAPMLEQMAPMPNMRRELDVPVPNATAPDATAPSLFGPGAAPSVNPYLRARPGTLEEMLGFRFQLTPQLEADNGITIQLRGLEKSSAAAPYSASAKVFEGDTVAFSIPMASSKGEGRVNYTFLLVTPRLTPQTFASPPSVLPQQSPVKPAP